MNDFNKRCAEVLGWKRYKAFTEYRTHIHNLSYWTITVPEHTQVLKTGVIEEIRLSFHDSYDWAMLLVSKLMADYPPNEIVKNPKLLEFLECFEWYYSTPHQIAQAALEVLEKNNEQ